MKELFIRKTDEKSFVKKLAVPHSLMHFKFNENGSELIALGSNSKMNDQYKQVCKSFQHHKSMLKQTSPLENVKLSVITVRKTIKGIGPYM